MMMLFWMWTCPWSLPWSLRLASFQGKPKPRLLGLLRAPRLTLEWKQLSRLPLRRRMSLPRS
uniref:Uncharacterized protein n=1 Tax=Setaria viridis TaxID=4556 RepID=A0A4U6VTE5_SETVI|nr:hypothetical protein SEVIR_2G212660v2 [Setaria viridis]